MNEMKLVLKENNGSDLLLMDKNLSFYVRLRCLRSGIFYCGLDSIPKLQSFRDEICSDINKFVIGQDLIQ